MFHEMPSRWHETPKRPPLARLIGDGTSSSPCPSFVAREKLLLAGNFPWKKRKYLRREKKKKEMLQDISDGALAFKIYEQTEETA